MKLSSVAGSRTSRSLILASIVGVGLAVAAATWLSAGIAAGIAVALLFFVVGALAKATMELSSDLRAEAAKGEETSTALQAQEQAVADAQAAIDRVIANIAESTAELADRLSALEVEVRELERSKADELAAFAARISAHEADLHELQERVSAVQGRQPSVQKSLTRLGERLGRTTSEVKAIASVQRDSIALLRSDIDELGRRLIAPVPAGEASRLARTDVDDPVLSIAIPSFNRTDHLARCLQSAVDEIEAAGVHDVEIHVTDDASTMPGAVEVAVDYANRYDYIGFRANERNLGLEGNVINSVAPCRGEYLLIMGSDDSFVPGALRQLRADLARDPCPVHLYEKKRVGGDGETAIPPIVGTSPIDIPRGASHRFGSLLESIEACGLMSTFGFTSQVVVRRADFAAVDASTYLGLTVFPHLGVFCEAFLEQSVCYHNAQLVHHRTPTGTEKMAESIGRIEEPFMEGGDGKRATYFGPSLGAMLQRIVKRTVMTHDDVASLPERLLTDGSLWDWIQQNVALAGQRGIEFDQDVIEDYEALRAAMGHTRPSR